MPLSEHEQRILDEIERKLSEEDPKFARGVTSTTPRGQAVRRLKRAIAGFVAGLCLLVGTLPLEALPLGVAAFALMLASAVVIASTAKHLGRERATPGSKPPTWVTRMEERWRKRFDKDER